MSRNNENRRINTIIVAFISTSEHCVRMRNDLKVFFTLIDSFVNHAGEFGLREDAN